MHQSIAYALYRGERRQFHPQCEKANARFDRMRYRFGRNAWMKAALEWALNYPAFIPVLVQRCGEKKHEEVTVLGFLHPDSLIEDNAWCARGYVLSAKTCTLIHRDLPLKVAHHTVLRLMQRADINQTRHALFWLTPAVCYALLLRRTPADEILLPAVTGAVIALRDKDEPDCWVFVTYIDDDKLRPEQKTEVAARQQELTAGMAAFGTFVTKSFADGRHVNP